MHLGVSACNLSTWVHFPDTERVEWLNKMGKHMWPFICQIIETFIQETIEQTVRGANAHFSTFSFTKMNMGQQPFRVKKTSNAMEPSSSLLVEDRAVIMFSNLIAVFVSWFSGQKYLHFT